jgi:hypothetical protein
VLRQLMQEEWVKVVQQLLTLWKVKNLTIHKSIWSEYFPRTGFKSIWNEENNQDGYPVYKPQNGSHNIVFSLARYIFLVPMWSISYH